MSRRPLRFRWIAWLVLWTYAATGLQPFEKLVLCIDAQGHVALEAATANGVCFDCPTVESPESGGCCSDPDPRDVDPGCDCDDVVLLGAPDGMLASRLSALATGPVLTPALRLHALLVPARSTRTRDVEGEQRPPGIPRAARSSILRI